MPTYKITDPTTGRTVRLTGESAPTEQELNDIFSQLGGSNKPEPAAVKTPKQPEPGIGQRLIEGISNPKPSYMRNVDPTVLGPALNVAGQAGRAIGEAVMSGAKALAPHVMNALPPYAKPFVEGGIEAGKMVLGSLKGNPVVDAATTGFNALPEESKNDWTNLVNAGNLAMAPPIAKGAAAVGKEGFNLARDLGSLTGQVAKKGVGKIIPKKAAQSILESGTKWSTVLSPEKRKAISKTMIDEKILPNPEGYGKLMDNIEGVKQQINEAIAPHENTPVQISDVIKRTAGEKKKAAGTFDPKAETAKIEGVIENFVDNWDGNLTVGKAQQIKTNIYSQLKKHYDSVDRGGQAIYTDGEIGTMKQIARGLKEEIEGLVHDAPIRDLNAREGQLWKLEPHLRRAVGRIENHNVFGLDDAIAAGMGTTVGAFTGGPIGAAIGAAAGGAAKRFLGHPVTKAKLAQKLDALRNAGIEIDPHSATGRALLGDLSGLENILAREAPGAVPIPRRPITTPYTTDVGPVRSGVLQGEAYGPEPGRLIYPKELPAGQGFELRGAPTDPGVIDAAFTSRSRPISRLPAPEAELGQLALPPGQGFELVDSIPIKPAVKELGELVEAPKAEFIGSGLRAARERMATRSAGNADNAENMVTYIEKLGGIKAGKDYNARILRQNPDAKRVLNDRTGQSPDAIASQLQAAGWPISSSDEMIELLKSGKGRKIYNPKLQDRLFARDIRREENEWAEEQIAKLRDTEQISTGSIRESLSDIKAGFSDEIGQEGFVKAGKSDKALSELSDFFAEMSGKVKKKSLPNPTRPPDLGDLIPKK